MQRCGRAANSPGPGGYGQAAVADIGGNPAVPDFRDLSGSRTGGVVEPDDPAGQDEIKSIDSNLLPGSMELAFDLSLANRASTWDSTDFCGMSAAVASIKGDEE